MGVLYLTESDVQSLVDMKTTLDVLEEAFRQLGQERAMNVPRRRAKAPGIVLHSMSAAAEYLGYVGWKNYTTTKSGARFHVGMYSANSGELVALLEADHLGRLRTGAATGVAAESMAQPEVTELGLFGTGKQAETQLAAICQVRNIKEAFVYGRDPDRRADFAARMSEQLGIDVTAADRPQEAVEELPIVITATTSREPVFHGEWVADGTFIAAVGSNALNRAELDAQTVSLANVVVCDSVEACQFEAGDFVDALDRGMLDWSKPVDLAAVVTGNAPGRAKPEDITLFKSVGLAIEDVALAAKIIERAREQGVGQELPI